jgi:hypothetical protein
MEDPSHYPRSTGKNSRRRGSIGGSTASRSPSAQETKDGPKQDDSRRRRVKENRDPEGVERDYTADQQATKTS